MSCLSRLKYPLFVLIAHNGTILDGLKLITDLSVSFDKRNFYFDRVTSDTMKSLGFITRSGRDFIDSFTSNIRIFV